MPRIRTSAARIRAEATSAARSAELRAAVRDLLASRLAVLTAGVFGVLAIGTPPGARGFDPEGLTLAGGSLDSVLAAPVARWDAVWYLSIAHHGYGAASGPDTLRTAFFPLYPLLVRATAGLAGSYVLAGVLVSLACLLAGLLVVERLAALDLGPGPARLTVTLLAFSPAAVFLSGIYSEALFLALSAGALLAARRDRWAAAGLLGGLAAATRNSGVLLLVPLAVILLWGPVTAGELAGAVRRRGAGALRPVHALGPLVRRGRWLLLVPTGLAAFLAYLALTGEDPLRPFAVERAWYHHFAGPFGGVRDGAVAAWDGVRQLLHGPGPPVYFRAAGGDPLQVAGGNLLLFGFLAGGAVAFCGVVRRLPVAYAAYVLVTLGATLSEPVAPQPLQSLPRYEVVLFPLTMAVAGWAFHRREGTRVVGISGVLLGLFTVEFATWRFVA